MRFESCSLLSQAPPDGTMVTCPSCSATYAAPSSMRLPESSFVKCPDCGYSWIEGRAVEIATAPSRNLPALIDVDAQSDKEIRRLLEASQTAREEFAARRRLRNRRLVAWGIFAAAVTMPIAAAAAFPELVVKMAPATVRFYEALGQDVNIYGLELRRIQTQNMLIDGTQVIAVKGEILNTSGSERKIPSLRFGLQDASSQEVYQWTLDSTARPLRPGESTTFVTRVASPPKAAANLEIRFAHADEIGSTQPHE